MTSCLLPWRTNPFLQRCTHERNDWLLEEQVLYLTPLHSKRSKLHRVLTVLSAIWFNVDPHREGSKNENDRVASPEGVAIHFNTIVTGFYLFGYMTRFPLSRRAINN